MPAFHRRKKDAGTIARLIAGYGELELGLAKCVGVALAFKRNPPPSGTDRYIGTGGTGAGQQGYSVALSADGNTAIVGGESDDNGIGAAWVFVPSLQATPASNIVATGNPGGPFAPSSFQYQLSATIGSINYSISGLGGPEAVCLARVVP